MKRPRAFWSIVKHPEVLSHKRIFIHQHTPLRVIVHIYTSSAVNLFVREIDFDGFPRGLTVRLSVSLIVIVTLLLLFPFCFLLFFSPLLLLFLTYFSLFLFLPLSLTCPTKQRHYACLQDAKVHNQRDHSSVIASVCFVPHCQPSVLCKYVWSLCSL